MDTEQAHDEQQLLGGCYVFKWNGRRIKLGALDEGKIADLVGECKSNAIYEHEEYMTLKYGAGPLSPEQLTKRQVDEDRFELRMSTGYYQWGEKGMTAWRASRQGARTVIAALLESGGNPLQDHEIIQLMIEGGEPLGRFVAAAIWDAEFPNVPRPAEMTPANNLEITAKAN